jgi:hypothetical protein
MEGADGRDGKRKGLDFRIWPPICIKSGISGWYRGSVWNAR